MPIRKIKNPYNFQQCRWCAHFFISHNFSETQFCGWVTSQDRIVRCPCKEFAPEDNLEYLEYLYNKKNII